MPRQYNSDVTGETSVGAGTPSLDAHVTKKPRISLYPASKRIMDVIVSLIALICTFPLLLLVACAIKATSKGPVLFAQVRWGRGGRKFRVYKFRTMFANLCDPTGVAQTSKNDRRITRLGAILRRTNVDELPQLYNVLKGDMSLVGPRCHAVGMLAAGIPYEEFVPSYHRRHVVRPGITGLAQSFGLRGPTDDPSLARARIDYDIYYVENRSLLMDIKIILRTFVTEIKGGSGF